MSKKVIETITLLSSDEESPSTVDIMKETRGEVIIKVEENVPLKSTAQKSTNSDGNHQTSFLKLSSNLPPAPKNTAKSQSTIVTKSSIKPAHNIQSQDKYSIFLHSSVVDKTNTSASNTHDTIASLETPLKNSINKIQHVTAQNNFSEPSQKARKSFTSSKVQNKQNLKLVTVAEDPNNSSKNVMHKNKFGQNTFTPSNSNEHTNILLQKSFKLAVQAQNIDKEVNLEKKISCLKTGENKSKVNSVINNLKTNSVNTISDIQKSDPEGNDASTSIQSHKDNSTLKYMENKLDDHSKDSVSSIVLSNAKCNATNNTQTVLKKLPKCLSITIANKDRSSHSNVSINHNDKDSSILKNESLSSSERKKLNSNLNSIVAGTPNIQMHKKELFSIESHCKNTVISSSDSKRKPNDSENSLLTSMPNCKRRKTMTQFEENNRISSVARPDLPVIEITSDGIAHIKKNDKPQTLANNIEIDVGKKLPNNHLNESNNITKSPSILQTMIDVTSVIPNSKHIISESKIDNINESTIESNYNINKSSNLDEISREITKDKESNVQNDEKCSKINNSEVPTLNSTLAVQQEIPMEVNGISETPKIQSKQVTSPKLSLKRKRLTEDVAKNDSFFKKGNLFANAESDSIRESENSSKDVNESIPSYPIIMDTKSVDKCSNSEEISLKLPNSTINCDSMLSENQQDHSDVSNILPGSSNSTTCAESNREKFEMLLEFCIPKLNLSAEESYKSRQIMYDKFAQAATLYTSSLEFSNFLDMIWEKMEKYPKKRMHHLTELKHELKAYKNSSSKTPDVSISQLNSPHHSNSDNIESAQLPVITESRISDLQTSVVCVTEVTEEELRSRYLSDATNSSSDATRVLSNNHNNTEQKDQARLNRKIKRVEKFLGKLDKKIRKLQATELSLDDLDDEDSAYIMEEKYKKKFQKAWELLCRYKNRSARLGSEIEKRFRYDGTRFEKLNRAVEKFMNKRKRTEKFPNYVDILDLIKKTNEALHIGLLESDYQGLAKQVFEDIGRELKKRRKRDIERDFGCFLTDEVKLEDDPAEKDEELKTKLNNSVAEGEKKISEIIENYAVKQETEVDVEEEEESDVSLEPEYHEPNDDLPDTDPATPENTDFPSNENISTPKIDKVTVIDIASDSNASTDPAPDCDNVKIEPVTCDVKSEFDFSNITSKLHKEIETDSDIELPEL